MTAKKERKAAPPQPSIRMSPNYKRLYVTGAIGSFSPFDYRLTFYTHEEQWSEEPSQIGSIPVSQVMQVTVTMSPDLTKRLSAMLNQQLKEREEELKKKTKAKKV